jgi:hypothetical protein
MGRFGKLKKKGKVVDISDFSKKIQRYRDLTKTK